MRAYVRTAQLQKIIGRAGGRPATAPSPNARHDTARHEMRHDRAVTSRVCASYAMARGIFSSSLSSSPSCCRPGASREFTYADRASSRPREFAGGPQHTHAAHGMKTRLDEGVSGIPATRSPWTHPRRCCRSSSPSWCLTCLRVRITQKHWEIHDSTTRIRAAPGRTVYTMRKDGG